MNYLGLQHIQTMYLKLKCRDGNIFISLNNFTLKV